MPATHWASFAHDAASVPKARHVVRTVLDGAGLDEMALAEIEIVVSEIVGNAVRHARPLADGGIHVQCEVTVEVVPGAGAAPGAAPHVEVAVTDGGAPGRVLAPRAPDGCATGGRGLFIVDGLADEWGVVDNVDDLSRTVWASFGGPTRHHPH
ncbi:ATP-binding protein [Kineococcus sp. SYSU DK006]|uniref:ATP-binding protein n=1 Tax=Kineococcus sp. SYSU DK006 TaxID=3383127 RepID=UPI003D7E6158